MLLWRNLTELYVFIHLSCAGLNGEYQDYLLSTVRTGLTFNSLSEAGRIQDHHRWID